MKSESFLSIFAKAVMSGIMISIGCIVYLSADNKYVGMLLFSFGLFTIIQFGFFLYTGKVGYIPENKPSYIQDVFITLFGNAVGTGFAAVLVRVTRIWDKIHENALAVAENKINDSFISQFVLGIFCGLLMYLAVDNARLCKEKGRDTSMVFGTAVPVMTFILCGFNHSVADCFYVFVAGISLKGFVYIITVALGNAFGGMLVPLMKKLYDK